MIRQDILAVKLVTGNYAFFAPSTMGVAALTKAGYSNLLTGGLSIVPNMILPEDKAVKLLRVLYRNTKVDTHYTDYPVEVVALNAEQMKIEHDRNTLATRMSDYFGPLLDAAIEARDKAKITELFNQFPQSVEKSFVIDRLRQEFPELKSGGVTLQDWHK